MYKLLFFNLRLLINTFLLLGLPILGINHAKAAITATQDLSSDTFSSNPSLNDGTTNFTCEDKISTNKYDKLVSFYETFISSPLLNDSKIHYTCKDKGFTKKYDKLMSLYENAIQSSEKTKATDELITFFSNHISNKDSDIRSISNYQLGHYYAFRVFDNYFNNEEGPSNINRQTYSPLNKELAMSYLSKVPELEGALRMIPNTWLTDYSKGFIPALEIYDNKRMGAFFSSHPEVNLNLFSLITTCEDYCMRDTEHTKIPASDTILKALLVAKNAGEGSPLYCRVQQQMQS